MRPGKNVKNKPSWRTLVALLLWWSASPAAGQTVPEAPADSCRATRASSPAALSVPAQRPVSWKLLIPNVVRDQKPVWLFPVKVARGEHLKPTLGFVFATAGLVALDPHDTPYFRRTSSFNDFNSVMSARKTSLGIHVFPLAFYALGLSRKDSYAQQTGLLATQALADAQILTLAMKSVDRRLRPRSIPPDGDFSHTWFKASGPVINKRSSFPSGHAMTAFAVATVFAQRYRHRRWVPWVAYGLAGVIGFSRITRQDHFPSDVFAGAVLGFSLSNYVVLCRPQ